MSVCVCVSVSMDGRLSGLLLEVRSLPHCCLFVLSNNSTRQLHLTGLRIDGGPGVAVGEGWQLGMGSEQGSLRDLVW